MLAASKDKPCSPNCHSMELLKKCLLIMVAYCDIMFLSQYVELIKEESKMSEPQIDRDTYRKIKKMSREELNDFLIR